MSTPRSRREYAADLEAHSKAYAIAADAPGLRKDAARFLYTESIRLHSEARINYEFADNEEFRLREQALAAVKAEDEADDASFGPVAPETESEKRAAWGDR